MFLPAHKLNEMSACKKKKSWILVFSYSCLMCRDFKVDGGFPTLEPEWFLNISNVCIAFSKISPIIFLTIISFKMKFECSANLLKLNHLLSYTFMNNYVIRSIFASHPIAQQCVPPYYGLNQGPKNWLIHLENILLPVLCLLTT